MAVDWGFSKNIQILTEGRVNPEEIYGFGRQAGDVFVGEVRKHLADPSNLYLFHSEESTVYPRLDVFLREARESGPHGKRGAGLLPAGRRSGLPAGLGEIGRPARGRPRRRGGFRAAIVDQHDVVVMWFST